MDLIPGGLIFKPMAGGLFIPVDANGESVGKPTKNPDAFAKTYTKKMATGVDEPEQAEEPAAETEGASAKGKK